MTAEKIDIGIVEAERKKIADGLSKLLADTYTLYLKTQNFHWNVTGPMFQTLHTMFEGQYINLAEAVDLIAERIRALGLFAPATYSEFTKLTSIKEQIAPLPAEQMIESLILGQESVDKTARALLSLLEQANDQVTIDLLTQRMQYHEKTAWMLRSLLQK